MNGVPWGGSEELWSQTALRLRELGHSVWVSVLSWPNRPERLAELASAGAKVTYRPRTRTLVGRLMRAGLRGVVVQGPLDVSESAWLKKASPHLIVISSGGPWDGVPWMLACRDWGLSYCSVINAHSESLWPYDDEIENIRTAFGSARRVFFMCWANHALVERQCGMRIPQAEVVASPLKVHLSEQPPWPGDNGDTEIACVARLDPRTKGQDILLEVVAQSKWQNRAFRLNVYGTGPCEKSVKALVSLLGLKNVRFPGYMAVRDIWAANHALVLPSRIEGLPLTLVEAMLCGRVVIATAVSGITELVRDGSNGFVALAPTPLLLDDAMERSWSRRQQWQEIGLRARSDALKAMPADPVGEFANKLLALAQAR
jgi:glycosyltransferase involved in cell wall biosynthesis